MIVRDETQQEIYSLERRSECRAESGIAIVGMAFRFPGDLSNEQDFWTALKDGRDLVSHIPTDRWAVDELQHDKRSEPGRSITFSAGALSRIDEFDAGFFGISPREAAWLDPQQRLLLELAWEAMENACIPPSSLAGSDCAVYVGISSLDYGTRGLDDLACMSAYSMTGNTLSIAANRLSYVFDLRGASLAVDTACSSSLVALHHACNCLRAGEASAALVGGVNLLLHPYPFVGFTKASMLSADGRCKAFDASGDGYVRAEGGAALLLKPLERAIADGDQIHAVILASGVNTDGARKMGITIPSRDGQAELMRSVLNKSGVSASDLDFIEAHGTGTAVGDPIEAAAIGAVYGMGRPQPLPIGSVKANLGHMEAASGMAGLIKAILALKNRALPPALHLTSPNPHIDFKGLNLQLLTHYTELNKEHGVPIVAGVNSFGFGGANAHVLIQSWLAQEHPGRSEAPSSALPLILSARTTHALRAMAERYAALLSGKSLADLYDIACTTAYHRERMENRLALLAADVTEASDLLAQYAQGKTPDRVYLEERLPEPGGIAFVYSGNGAQWCGMAQKLMAESGRFAEIIGELDAMMQPVAGFPLTEELQADAERTRLYKTEIAQPLLFAIQVAVTRLLSEHGVTAAAVMGHSVGEVAAAWAAGALDLAQAIRVISARSAAQAITRGTGRMAAVVLSAAAMQDALHELDADLDVEIAAVNSPNNVTISGNLADLERIGAHLEKHGVFFRLLDLDYAFHSRRMDAIHAGLTQSLAGLEPSPAETATFVSTVTGAVLAGTALDAGYWWRNVREPVRFADAVTTLASLGCRVFLEIGPHAILQRYIGESLLAANIKGRVLPTLRRGDDGLQRIVEAALRIHLLADKPRLDAYFPEPWYRVRLPTYPWQRERHWHPRTSESLLAIERRRVHPLLGWPLPEAELAWENILDPIILPWLADHQVGDAIVFPGAAYVEMALAAARAWMGGEQLCVEGLDIVSPMIFDGEHARTLRLTIHPRDGSFQIKSRQRLSSDAWTLHASGRVLAATGYEYAAHIAAVSETMQEVGKTDHYRLAAMLGLDYGPAFQGLAWSRVAEDRLEARLEILDSLQIDSYLLHPAVLDVCYQSLVDFFRSEIETGHGLPFLPVKVGRVDFYRHAVVARFRARLRCRSTRSVLADFELLDAAGNLTASISGCRFRVAPLLHRGQKQVSYWHVIPRLRPHPLDEHTSELPSIKYLIEKLYANLDWSGQRQQWFRETLPLLEALTLSFAYEALHTIMQEAPHRLQQLKETSPYVRWLLGLLQQEGILVEKDGQWHESASGNLPQAAEIWQTLLREAPACLPQLTLIGRVGRHLRELIVGELDACQFLQSLWQTPAIETLYDDDPSYLGMRLALEHILCDLASNWPAHRRLRILEIAAGSSELPRRLIQALPEDRLVYVVALADEKLVLRQQAEYQEYANVSVVGLNSTGGQLIASDDSHPLPEAFDVVILRHVLHRAPSPRAMLVQLRRRMALGGVMLLAERHADWSADFVAGLDPAWWHANADPTVGKGVDQPLSPLHSPEVWHHVLHEEAFEDIELFTEPAAQGLAEGAYLLLAKRPNTEVIAQATSKPATWLLMTDAASSHVVECLRTHLESLGHSVTLAGPRLTTDIAGVDHVVHLVGWMRTPVEACSVMGDVLNNVQTLASYAAKPRLWLITQGGALAADMPTHLAPNPVQSALWGFGRVVMNECPALRCTLIDLAYNPSASKLHARLVNELLHPDGADEIVLTAQARYSLVLQELQQDYSVANPAGEDARYRLDFRMPGQLCNLIWLPEAERALRDNEIEVRTQTTGLNFRDVMYLMGLLPDEAVEDGFAGASLGLEFSGIVTRVGARVRDFQPGQAVMGFGASCFASHIVTHANAVAPMPEGWTFEAAATVPTVFFTVYYALKHLADLQAGERVLIHGAAGGVGIAAVQLARYLGAEVFATAGSEEKRDFVRQLGADHVFDSRSLSFADDILAMTAGEGVDVVLNSLAGEAIRRNLHVLKPFGRFLELGKRDFYENTPIGLRYFKDNISYFAIDADQLLTKRPALAARLFREVMALFREGALFPLPYRCFPAGRVIDAFRVMQQSRHIGKIVVSLAGTRPRIDTPAKAHDTLSLASRSTWLITGGLSGFGLESARWLASRGVRNLVLVGRRGMETPGTKQAIQDLTAEGVNAVALSCDISDANALGIVIEHVRKTMPLLKGILHAAAVFNDRLISSLDAESLDAVLRAKLLGAWNLHELTLDVPLDYFILYSSVTTAIGNPGQANYVAANTGLEGLAQLRRHMGLPATCIGWGPIGDAGYLTRNRAVKDSLSQRMGAAPLTASEAMAQLDRILAQESGPITVANFDWNVLSLMLPSASSARFAVLNHTLKNTGLADDNIDFHALIVNKTAEDVAKIVRNLVTQEVAQILCIGAGSIEPNHSLHALGLDSLMAVELVLGLEQRFGIQLSVMMLNDAPTIERVSTLIVDKLLGSNKEAQPAVGAETTIEHLARQHGEAVSAEEASQVAEGVRTLAQKGARLTT